MAQETCPKSSEDIFLFLERDKTVFVFFSKDCYFTSSFVDQRQKTKSLPSASLDH